MDTTANRSTNINPMKREFDKFKKKWANFGFMLFDPMHLILVGVTILFVIIYSNNNQIPGNQTYTAILTLIISLLTGLLGGFYAKKWDEITEEKVITARGKSANRSLQLLLNSTISLEKRVRLYYKRYTDEDYRNLITDEIVKTYLEEVMDECISIEQEVINSIEDWKDILHDADIKAVISLIRDLNANYDATQADLESVNNNLKEAIDAKDKSESVIEKLKKDKEQKEIEINQIRKELRDKSNEVGIPALGTSLITGSSMNLNNLDYSSPSGVYLGIQGPTLEDMSGRTYRAYPGISNPLEMNKGITGIPKGVTITNPTEATTSQKHPKKKKEQK